MQILLLIQSFVMLLFLKSACATLAIWLMLFLKDI